MTDAPDYCARLVKDQDYDRWLTTQFLKPNDRRRVLALYAFNHEIAKTRETVSEPTLGEIRLQWWRDALTEIAAGNQRSHPVVAELAGLGERFSAVKPLLDSLVDARRQDLAEQPPATRQALIGYADATGGALCEAAMILCDARATEPARCVGTAWALMGLIRALAFQAAMQRTSLPQEELDRAGIRAETLFRGEFAPELLPFVETLVGDIKHRLAKAREDRAQIKGSARPVLLLAGLTDSYLNRLARAGGDPLRADFNRGQAGRMVGMFVKAAAGRF